MPKAAATPTTPPDSTPPPAPAPPAAPATEAVEARRPNTYRVQLVRGAVLGDGKGHPAGTVADVSSAMAGHLCTAGKAAVVSNETPLVEGPATSREDRIAASERLAKSTRAPERAKSG